MYTLIVLKGVIHSASFRPSGFQLQLPSVRCAVQSTDRLLS
ncbi:hypothetical protein SynMEDNS5_00380 [Synechococcus sp. MEDNS5]|nr:hypothetical protein SynMEDNS5_00380 [Synechococcus sp. MEDNS5]